MELTAHCIYTRNTAGGVVGVGSAAAAAIKPGKAVFTFLMSVNVAELEFVTDLLVSYAGEYISQQEAWFAYELMAGVEIPAGSDGHVFRSYAAA